MIPAETRYKTHDGDLLAIVEAFKTWKHYLKDYKHEGLILPDYNNLRRFIDTKSLRSRQIRLAQEFSCYPFQTDYRPGKTNGSADVLSHFPQRNQAEENGLRTENTRILHKLQFLLTNISLSSLSTQVELSPLYRVFICGTLVLPQLWQFSMTFRTKLADEASYKASIGSMRLRLSEL